MDRERWEKIEKLFQAAWELPAGEQDSFLAVQCSGDDKLRNEVRALLNQRSAGVLDHPDWKD